MSKISVIMGIYNCEATLGAAIESILAQTYTDYELIMCDDGSTDGTYALALAYAEKHSNIKLLKNEKNMRLAYSLNRCLSVAEGEYIARMDADDLSCPERFEKQVAFLDAHQEIDLLGTSLTIKDGDKLLYNRIYECDPIKSVFLTSSPFAHPTIMMRKSVLDALGGYRVSPETMRCEDLDLWFRFAIAGYKGVNLPDPLYLYQESISDYKKRTVKAALGIRKVYLKYYKETNAPFKYKLMTLKPVIAAFLPASFKARHHKKAGQPIK